MNVEQNYDAVEGKGAAEPRAIRMGDVLAHQAGDHYWVLANGSGKLILANLRDGAHYSDGAFVGDINCLSRVEARLLCGDNWEYFRLVGRAKDVLKVNDPGE